MSFGVWLIGEATPGSSGGDIRQDREEALNGHPWASPTLGTGLSPAGTVRDGVEHTLGEREPGHLSSKPLPSLVEGWSW